MKKVLIITNVVTIGILFCTWFTGCEETPPPPPPPPPPGACFQEPTTGNFQFNGPDAIKLVTNYTKNHWEDINNGNNIRANTNSDFLFLKNAKDSRSVWFSLSRLKGFIAAIENNAPQSCCDTLGLRIYFAEYDAGLINTFQTADPDFNPNNEEYREKSTVIMIPTYRWSNGKDHDFNPLYPGLTCNVLQTDSAWKGPIMALAMNHGGIVPPPYPTANCNDYMISGADFMVYGVDYTPTGTSPNPYYNSAVPATPGCGD